MTTEPTNTEQVVPASAAQPARSLRDKIRSSVFSEGSKTRTKIIPFYGEEVEIRQTTIGDVLDSRDSIGTKDGVLGILLDQVYVPGTDEKVFEDTDIDALKKLGFNEDVTALIQASAELSNVNLKGGFDTSSETDSTTA